MSTWIHGDNFILEGMQWWTLHMYIMSDLQWFRVIYLIFLSTEKIKQQYEAQ